MKKTVLITGASMGIGKLTARRFAAEGWNVAATMRAPEKETELGTLQNVRLYALDVTSAESVQSALAAAHGDFGRIDAVVNNAGFGADGVFESMSDEFIHKQFDTNVFGLMRVTRESVRMMREQGGGTIVQISSLAGRITFPLFTIYHASKWAVEGFSESLQFELAPHNIRVKIVEPGAIKTEFYGSSRAFTKPDYTDVYDDFVARCEKVSATTGARGADPAVVASTIFRACTDTSARLRYPVAYPSGLLLTLRRILPERWFLGVIRKSYRI
jgi:NAD(P)-dependent dehydrogenase (short-subunit alcohol dehydrogenase family)